jgi:hypothetical protein
MNNSLYGLKKEPRAWYEKMDSYMLSHDFVRCKSHCNVYMMRSIDFLIILVLYVDDILIIGNSDSTIIVVKDIFHEMFSLRYMGTLHLFICLEISQDASGINISQDNYVRDLLDRFHKIECKYTPTPFLSSIRLEDGEDTPLVENTLYQ